MIAVVFSLPTRGRETTGSVANAFCCSIHPEKLKVDLLAGSVRD
jgi:hypothetical protein